MLLPITFDAILYLKSTSLIKVFIKTQVIHRIALEIHGVIRLALIPFVMISKKKKKMLADLHYPSRTPQINIDLFTIKIHRKHL